MKETYLKDTAGALNKVFQLYKKKLSELPNKPRTASEVDKVSDWFGKTVEEFNAMQYEQEDADVANFVIHFASACCLDLSDKYEGKSKKKQYRWFSKDYSLSEFGEFIKTAEKGDCLRVEGVKVVIIKEKETI